MEIRILEERTNPLLKRHELTFEVSHATAATPTRESVRVELAKAVHAQKDRVIIERMVPRYGTAVTRGDANVYDTADAAKSITREHILVRNGLKEKAAKGPAPAAEAPAAPEAAKPAAPAPAAAEASPPPAPEPAKPEAEPAAHPKETHHKAGGAHPKEPAAHAKDAGEHPKGDAAETAPATDAPKHGKPHAKKE